MSRPSGFFLFINYSSVILLLKCVFDVFEKVAFMGSKVMLLAACKGRVVQNRLQFSHLFIDAE